MTLRAMFLPASRAVAAAGDGIVPLPQPRPAVWQRSAGHPSSPCRALPAGRFPVLRLCLTRSP